MGPAPLPQGAQKRHLGNERGAGAAAGVGRGSAIEWLIGLPDVCFLAVDDGADGEALIHVETSPIPRRCPSCGVIAWVMDRARITLVDLPMVGRLARLAWHKLGTLGRSVHEKLTGLLCAGDSRGDVATMWEAKEAVRNRYAHADPELALEWVTQLGHDLHDADYPPEARWRGRTRIRWRKEIAASHAARVSNGPNEAVNNLGHAREARGVRLLHVVPQLPDPLTALRRQAQLDPLTTVTPRSDPKCRKRPSG